MKKLFLFLCTLITLSGIASTKYAPLSWNELGYYGYQQVYNMETDGGLTNHQLTQAAYTTAINACSYQQIMYFPGNTWTLNAVNLQCTKGGITIMGDGNAITTLRIASGLSTSSSDNAFVFIGVSDISILNIRGVGMGTHRINAFWKFNSMGSSNSTECKNILLDHIAIDSTWGHGVMGGETSAGTTHHILDMTVSNSRFTHIGDPANPYVTDNVAPSSTRQAAINFNGSTWRCNALNNYIEGCSGNGIKINRVGWQNSTTGLVDNEAIGADKIIGNYIKDCHILIECLGNLANKPVVSGNTLINPTRNSGFLISYTARGGTFSNNTGVTYDGRDGIELGGGDNVFDKTNVIRIYVGSNPEGIAPRTVKGSSTNFVLNHGWTPDIWGTMIYDMTYAKSSMCPDRRSGIHAVEMDDATNQPTSWRGKSYMYGYHISAHMYNTTAPAVRAENVPVSQVYIEPDFYFESPYQTENVIKVYNTTGAPGWFLNGGTFNVIGSSAPSKTNGNPNWGIMGTNNDAGRQGGADSRSAVHAFKFIGSSAWLILGANGIISKTGNQVSNASFGSSN